MRDNMILISNLAKKILERSNSYKYYRNEFEQNKKRIEKLEKTVKKQEKIAAKEHAKIIKKQEKINEKQRKINESNNKLVNSLFVDYQLTPTPRLKNFQDLSVEFLKLIDNICLKHNITWMIEGGLVLGAVRHGGFIPWDDDLDIGMLRDDYDHFIAVIEEEFERIGIKENIKVVYKKRDWYDKKPEAFLQVLYYDESKIGRSLAGVDVFPYDFLADYDGRNLSDEYEEAKKKFYWDLTHGVERKDAYKNLYKNLNLTHEKQNHFIHGIEGPAGKRGVIDVMAFETDKMLPFERINFHGAMLPAPKDTDYYLKLIYKDFWGIPDAITVHNRMPRIRRAPNISEILEKNVMKLKQINENFDDL